MKGLIKTIPAIFSLSILGAFILFCTHSIDTNKLNEIKQEIHTQCVYFSDSTGNVKILDKKGRVIFVGNVNDTLKK